MSPRRSPRRRPDEREDQGAAPKQPAPAATPPEQLLDLQRTAGNQAVARLVGGSPLPQTVRGEMEGLFGRSFADVRVHESGRPEQHGALATTTGSDVDFASGSFAPETPAGRFLVAHELAHVAQQSGSPRGAGPAPLADPTLEREADKAGSRAAAGERVAGQSLTPVAARGPVSQHFEEAEHRKIGDAASAGPQGQTRTVELAPEYRITYGEMVAMAGDHFESIDEMRKFAANMGTGAGTREEIEYVRVVKILGISAAKAGYSEAAREAADMRFNRLASDNPTHFMAPESGDSARPIGERAEDGMAERLISMNPLQVEKLQFPRNAVSAYHAGHIRALAEAATAGKAGTSIDSALAAEAFACHFLTDGFSGGHVRTERKSAKDYWTRKVPMFAFNLQGYLAQKVAEDVEEGLPYGTEAIYSGRLPFNWAGSLRIVGAGLAAQGVALAFGDVVSGAIHDYDNRHGVKATAGGEDVTLFGDDRLGQGDEERLAVAAVRASVAEVERAWDLGRAGIGEDDLVTAIKGPGPMFDDLFAAERLMPVAKANDEMTLDPDATPAIKWDYADYTELLADFQFREALKIFCANKAGKLDVVVADESDDVKASVKKIGDRMRSDQAPDLVREVVEWVPDTGGGWFGHNQDDNALDYIERAAAVEGGLQSLAVPQRVKLIKFLFDGKTFGDEEDAAFAVWTANPAHITEVKNAIDGWGHELEDELGEERYLEGIRMAPY
jgi:Domain of unknown function (DUF4157)